MAQAMQRRALKGRRVRSNEDKEGMNHGGRRSKRKKLGSTKEEKEKEEVEEE